MAVNGPVYRAVYSDAVRAMLTAHVDALLEAGWTKKVLLSLIASLDHRLKHDPNNFGEPLYTLLNTKIKVCVGFVRPFAVQFAVHEQSKSVFIREVVLMKADKPT